MWREVPGAAAYHLYVGRKPNFVPLLLDLKLKESAYSLPGLPPDKYYWRVLAVDAQGVDGSLSEPFIFTISRQTAGPPPALTIEVCAVKGSLLNVGGRTAPGATVTVNGRSVQVQDGRFFEYITLDKPGRQSVVIRAIGANGGHAEETRTVDVPN